MWHPHIWDADTDLIEPRLSGTRANSCRFYFSVGLCSSPGIASLYTYVEITCDRELYVNICKTSNVVHQQDKMRWIAIYFFFFFFFFLSVWYLLQCVLIMPFFGRDFNAQAYISHRAYIHMWIDEFWRRSIAAIIASKKEREKEYIGLKKRYKILIFAFKYHSKSVFFLSLSFFFSPSISTHCILYKFEVFIMIVAWCCCAFFLLLLFLNFLLYSKQFRTICEIVCIYVEDL